MSNDLVNTDGLFSIERGQRDVQRAPAYYVIVHGQFDGPFPAFRPNGFAIDLFLTSKRVGPFRAPDDCIAWIRANGIGATSFELQVELQP